MPKLNADDKKRITQELDLRLGGAIADLSSAYEVENELRHKRIYLEGCLNIATDQVPPKLSFAIRKAEESSYQIETFQEKSEKFKEKVNIFLNKISPLTQELNTRFSSIKKLQDVLEYLKTFEKVDIISAQLQQCTEDDQAVLLYRELKDLCSAQLKGHQANYVKEYTHYWHNILEEKYAKQYEDLMKQLKWPFSAQAENEKSPPPKEILTKFGNVTKYLFLIEEPKNDQVISYEYDNDLPLCLPVKILLRPLKKRFAFHFTGSRQTARIDRPEWFLTQTLTWIRDHREFLQRNVQPVADRLYSRRVLVEDQFNAGIIALAAERLHTVLGLYHTQGLKGEMLDVDAAFAHAVDETLGFHRELTALTGRDANGVLAVLTKAETFLRWLTVEKKYALAKMDETLSTEHWMEPAAGRGGGDGGGGGGGAGVAAWVPRGADWFVSLLKTVEERYSALPQPGHRLQFLELQLELVEEWRVRLTQILSAGVSALAHEAVPAAAPRPVCAVTNAAHHTATVLLRWAHSLHYLQLHYYRQQFQHFTQRQHRDESDADSVEDLELDSPTCKDLSLSLRDVEWTSRSLALQEARDASSQSVGGGPSSAADAACGVFGDAPVLLARLLAAGLAALADHTLMELKAAARDYAKLKWHSMPVVEAMQLSISPSLCRPLAGLCARLHAAEAALAPALFARLRTHVASEVDLYLFEELVLQAWWNAGGAQQLTHDVSRNMLPALAGAGATLSPLPRLTESCTLLSLAAEEARRLRSALSRAPDARASLAAAAVTHVPCADALRILNQRTDLGDSPASLMELF